MTNRVVHFEIPIDDRVRAGVFYENALGWKITKWRPVDRPMTSDGELGAGVEGIHAPRTKEPEGALMYVGVDSVDATLGRVEDAGGKLVTAKMLVPGMGWLARFRDPEGNLIGLFEIDPTAS